jgi:hypothetical protein
MATYKYFNVEFEEFLKIFFWNLSKKKLKLKKSIIKHSFLCSKVKMLGDFNKNITP